MVMYTGPDAGGMTGTVPYSNRVQYWTGGTGGSGGSGGTNGAPGTIGPPAPDSAMTGDGLNTWTGEAAKFTPSMINDIYENPWYTIPSLSGFEGIGMSSPGYQALRDFGADPLSLFNIIQGSQGMIDQTGGEDFINFLAQLYKSYGAVGGGAGASIDARSLVDTIFGQGGNVGEKANNTLGTILGAGDMSTQVRTLYNLLRDVSNVGQNPLAASGYQAAMMNALDKYGSSQVNASTDPNKTMGPVEWIRANYANLV